MSSEPARVKDSNGINVTVLGVGRLGICLALVLERAGYNVLGVDVIQSYVDALNNKTYKSNEPRVSEFLKEASRFKATMNLDEGLAYSSHIFIMVATPTGLGEKSYDHSMLSKLLLSINDRKAKNKHVFIGCTVLPGFIAHTARYLLRDCENIDVSYNPEFIAQGDVISGLLKPDMVLIGEGSKKAGDFLESIYLSSTHNKPKIHRMSPESAEITKLAVNCFVTTKIAFANMIGDIAEKTPGASAASILSAVGDDSRVGNKYLRPGYGFGGPCFPRDNRALGNYSRIIGVDPIIPLATDNSNQYHARFMADQLLALNKEEYSFDDVAYKPKCPVDIIEESQKLHVAVLVAKAGKKSYYKGSPRYRPLGANGVWRYVPLCH